MAGSDWDWEEEATAAGWCSPDDISEKLRAEKAKASVDMKAQTVDAITREFERLAALDEMPRTLGDKILQVIQNEARYGRW